MAPSAQSAGTISKAVGMKTGRVSDVERTSKRGNYFGYLVERGSSLHFRVSVPKQLRQAMGKTEIRLSLGQVTYTVARPRAFLLVSRIRSLFEYVAIKVKEGKELDKSRLNATMHKLLNWKLDYLESMIADMYHSKDAEYIANDLRDYSKEITSKIYTNNEIDGMSVFDSWYCSIEDNKRNAKDLKDIVVDKVANELDCSKELASDVFDTFKEEIRTSEDRIGANVFTARGYVDRVTAIAYKHSANKVDGSFDINEAHRELSNYFPLDVEPSTLQHNVANKYNGNTTTVLALGEAIEKYIERLDSRIGKSGNRHGSKFKRPALVEMGLILGKETLISNITADMIEGYADKLKHIPPRLHPDKLKFCINEFGVSKHSKETMATKTISKRLTDVSAFIEWLKGNRYIDKDHADSLRQVISYASRECKDALKREGGSPTRPYSISELSTLFSSEPYLKWTRKRPDYFWPPIIALFTGMRMGEIMTLRRKDIKVTPEPFDIHIEGKTTSRHNQKEGIHYIDLTSIREKRLKDDGAASHRPIPIHPFLVELGFIEYVQKFKREDFIFREGLMLNSNGSDDYRTQFKAQYKLTDRFITYRRSLGIGRQQGETEGDKLDFHCFRNTMIAKLRDCCVHPELRCEISGHADGEDGTSKNESHSGYGDKYSIEQKLHGGIMKLDFHEVIPELKLLAQSKWARGGVKKR